MESKIKYLEMIQNIINRMANNSFLLKEWSVILVSALFALSANDSNIVFISVAFFPIIVFWILDGYFLKIEREYRKFYDKVRILDDANLDFCLNRKSLLKKEEMEFLVKVIFSKTLWPFYGIILGVVIVARILAGGK
ncbi:MAG: hypothetical protein KA059_00430 [Elusimicrobiales bacterium]|nr:hypothetical protein [Elusimicrobiales bacterium]